MRVFKRRPWPQSAAGRPPPLSGQDDANRKCRAGRAEVLLSGPRTDVSFGVRHAKTEWVPSVLLDDGSPLGGWDTPDAAGAALQPTAQDVHVGSTPALCTAVTSRPWRGKAEPPLPNAGTPPLWAARCWPVGRRKAAGAR